MLWHQGEHVLQLYPDKAPHAGLGLAFAAEGLRRQECVVVIGSMARWQGLLGQLQAAGIEAHAAVADGRLRLFGAQTVLASASVAETLRAILRFARPRGGGLRIVSELSDLLWRRADYEGALVVEQLWNALARSEAFSLACACGLEALEAKAYDGPLQRLAAQHTHLMPLDNCEAFDEAIAAAVADVLEPKLLRMVHALSAAQRPAIQLPSGVALLFWLKQHMPRTADKVFARSKVRWTAH